MPESSQTLFQQCNQLSNRIGSMIKLVKEVGFYDASVPELSQLRGNPPDGTYVPIAGMAQRIAQAGGKADGTVNSVLARWDNASAHDARRDRPLDFQQRPGPKNSRIDV